MDVLVADEKGLEPGEYCYLVEINPDMVLLGSLGGGVPVSCQYVEASAARPAARGRRDG